MDRQTPFRYQNGLVSALQRQTFNRTNVLATPEITAAEIDVDNLKAGDLLKYKWFCGDYHHGIVKHVNGQQVTLIHWQGERVHDFSDHPTDVKLQTEVIEENVVDLKKKSKLIYRCEFNTGSRSNPVSLTLARANAWRGERGYHLRQNVCKDFALFCKIGGHQGFLEERIICCFFGAVAEAGGEASHGRISVKFKRISSANDALSDFDEIMRDMKMGVIAFLCDIGMCLNFTDIYNMVKHKTDGEECMMLVLECILKHLEKVCLYDKHGECKMSLRNIRSKDDILCNSSVQVGIFLNGKLFDQKIRQVGVINRDSASVRSDGSQSSEEAGWDYWSVGRSVAKGIAKKMIKHKSWSVRKIEDLKPGDQVVLYKWWLHPRCHMIVVGVNAVEKTFDVIRFTYGKGVIKETVPFCEYIENIEKVEHHEDDVFPADKIIERAHSKMSEPQCYDIREYNCKHFAFWCTTGKIPKEP
ncbi:hypothetical protein BSL78_09360 [Apostichopus japonicus]|uniref:LRAT domain-containing protein n=1 Tax=Stichopus japonicus TaxID=307972 RepID=A0A2G8L0U6_STIJA|nr:hypothetical protein BSL78_09360 [Apostichopus japonicus]